MKSKCCVQYQESLLLSKVTRRRCFEMAAICINNIFAMFFKYFQKEKQLFTIRWFTRPIWMRKANAAPDPRMTFQVARERQAKFIRTHAFSSAFRSLPRVFLSAFSLRQSDENFHFHSFGYEISFVSTVVGCSEIKK